MALLLSFQKLLYCSCRFDGNASVVVIVVDRLWYFVAAVDDVVEAAPFDSDISVDVSVTVAAAGACCVCPACTSQQRARSVHKG